MSNRVGAPLGGRVHWLLLNLSGNFKVNHTLSYDYKSHCYTFYRNISQRNKSIIDVYIIIRTSKRCFKLMYNNLMQDIYITKSFKTSKLCACYMDKLFKDFKAYEEKNVDNT